MQKGVHLKALRLPPGREGGSGRAGARVSAESVCTQDWDGEGSMLPSLRDEQRNPALQGPCFAGGHCHFLS